MAVSGKRKTPRKVIVVRIVCVVMAVLLIVPVILASILSGGNW